MNTVAEPRSGVTAILRTEVQAHEPIPDKEYKEFVRLGFERLTNESKSQLRSWLPKMLSGRERNCTLRKTLDTPQKTTLLTLQ